MSRIELAKIPSLTFYKDSYTTSRRTNSLPQLICRGAPCKLYAPEVVRCVSLPGASGTDVDWKCEADLPESLRFGRVEVSCEGWSGPGDPYVLKGSCSLEYRLVHVPSVLRNPDSPISRFKSYDLSTIAFSILWIGFLLFILYSLFVSCFGRNAASQVPRPPPPHRPRPGSSGGWFPGGMDDDHSPPPPYSKNAAGANEGWRPGFWTGAALGGIANYLFNNRRPVEPRPTIWDWEREQPRSSIFGLRRAAPPHAQADDRGEGSSNLGTTRRSTGIGGSNVR